MTKAARAGLSLAALLAATALWLVPAGAESRGGRDPSFHPQHLIDTHVRYPGDYAYSFGTVRRQGPEQGPYVERCGWSFNSNLSGFGITQTCVRYTNENTN